VIKLKTNEIGMLWSRDREKLYVHFFVVEDNMTIRPADVSVIERQAVFPLEDGR
jgi:hypothetical protein